MDTVLKLRELRARAGLTQEEVAARSGVGAKTLSSFESGARITSMKLAQLHAILGVYGITEADFFGAKLDRLLAPWDIGPPSDADNLFDALNMLPCTARTIVLDKLRVAIDVAGALAPERALLRSA